MTETVLITGASGFLGAHMTRYQVEERHRKVVALYWNWEKALNPIWPKESEMLVRKRVDITNPVQVERAVLGSNADAIYHFAGQSFVVPSFEDPEYTMRVNLTGTLNVMETVRQHKLKIPIGHSGSGTQYGAPDQVPTPETADQRPTSPYATSKVAADALCRQYFEVHDVQVFRYRLFGTTGVGKRADVCHDFAAQIAAIERRPTDPPVVRVGNVDLRRDIQHVRNATEAMNTILENGKPGDAYNVGSGVAYHVEKEILNPLLEMTNVRCRVEVDPARFRPGDEPIHQGDITKLIGLGWTPRHTLRGTLQEILDSRRAMT